MRKLVLLTILTSMICCISLDAYSQGTISRPHKPTPVKPILTVNGNSESLFLEFSDVGETKQLSISTNQGTPTVQSMPIWLSITGITAKSIEVKCEPNPTTSSRDGSFEIKAGKLSVTVKVSQAARKILINGHECVDLGLPSGIKWATCNVGANSPGDYGYYYAWGETRPKSNYDWRSCFDCLDSTGDSWGTYKIGGKTQISATSGHDTARENWGSSWRIPTFEEFEELRKECRWFWSARNGHAGYVVTGPNGNSIFLPATGYRDGTDCKHELYYGFYWSSTLCSSYSHFAINMYFDWSRYGTDFGDRSCGLSVRPVTE